MPRRLWLAICCSALLLGLGSPTSAVATDVSTEELTRLVEAAQTDPDAMETLTTVTSIDGGAVDMEAILDADFDEQLQRLVSLQRLVTAPGTGHDSDALRSQANEITSRPPYTGEVASGNGLIARIGEFLSQLLSGGVAQGLGLVVLAGVVFAAAFLIMDRRAARRRIHTQLLGDPEAEVAVDYRAEAADASASGDFSAAVRLLFIDGAVRLEDRHLVKSAATTSTATVRPLVEDPHFLDRFDAIAYGGEDAGDEDVAEARSAWDRLMTRLGTR